MQLGEWEIPAGMGLDASVILLHRHPDLYPDPDEYRPERFVERRFAAHEFLPFGGGVRRCLGATFAIYEMKIVLGTLMGMYDLRMTSSPKVRPKRHGLVMVPAGGVQMVCTGRREQSTPAA